MDDQQQLPDEDLWAQLGEVTGRERIDVLYELGDRASQRQDFPSATSLWQEMETTANEVGDAQAAAEAVRLQGVAAFYSGEYEDAIALYRKAARAHEEAGRLRDAAAALWCLADTFRATGDFEGQLQAAADSRAMAESEEAPTMAGDACLMQARALYMLNREQEALTACAAGREHYRSAPRPEKVAQIDDFALSVHLYLGNLDEALELARGCLVLARMSSSEADDSYARLRLAEVFHRRGSLEEAMGHAEIAMQEFRTRDDLLGVAKCEELRGQALDDNGESEKALEAFTDGRVLFDAMGCDYDALRCETRRAILMHNMGDYDLAAQANRRLIRAFSGGEGQQVELHWSVVRLLDNFHEDGQHDECLKAAVEHLDKWPEGVTAADPAYREFLGLYALALEREGQIEQATAISNHVIAQTPAREASLGTAYCYEVRGRSQLESDEGAASQDFSHAIALHLARNRVDRAKELSAYFLPVDKDSGRAGAEDPVGGHA
ncbi:MAG: hypothetical protein V9G10_12910 [Candidatus Nanopelagicales bacterium]